MGKVILCDVDDVLHKFLKIWIETLNKQYQRDVKPEDIKSWNVLDYYEGLTRKQLYAPLSTEEFWDKVEPVEEAAYYIQKLIDEGNKIYLCTASNSKEIHMKYEKIIKKYYPMFTWQDVIVTSKKQMIKGDFLIDDGIHNLEGGEYIGILFTAPHNDHYACNYPNIVRANNWKEVYWFVNHLRKEDKDE